MATMKGSILGKLRGSVGDFSSRIFKGNNIICNKPASFNAPNDERSILRRQKFAMSSKFTKAVNSIPVLKAVWNKLKPADLNTYNFIFQTNYKQLSGSKLTDLNTITPFFGFPVSAQSVSLASDTVSVELAPLGASFTLNPEVETNIKLLMVMYMDEPADSQAREFYMYPMEFNSVPIQTDQPLSFTRSFDDTEKLIYEKYGYHKAYFAVVTLDADGNPVRFSTTTASE
jgi:hypothetical protein